MLNDLSKTQTITVHCEQKMAVFDAVAAVLSVAFWAKRLPPYPSRWFAAAVPH